MQDDLNIGGTMKKDEPVGEYVTEFEKGEGKGPFNCGNCVHMSGSVCVHPVMIALSKQPKKNGKPVVDKDDCCRYVRRKGD